MVSIWNQYGVSHWTTALSDVTLIVPIRQVSLTTGTSHMYSRHWLDVPVALRFM